MDEICMWGFGGKIMRAKPELLEEKPVPVPLCTTQIPYNLQQFVD
jgi:hypothetical protein